MNLDLLVVLLCLGATVAMFVANRPRMDAVALLVIALLPFTGVLTVGEALAGFSDPNLVLIAALFVLGAGLVRTGVARRLGDWLLRRAGQSEVRLVALLMLVVAGLGSVMSSTAVVAIFIPVVLRITQTTGMAAGHLMMPLSAAALISGMQTLVATTPNLVVNSALVKHGAEGFAFFSFTPFGLPILALGIAYMMIARHWLPAAPAEPSAGAAAPSLADWVTRYRLEGREHRVRVAAGSMLIGRSLGELALRHSGINVVALERAGRRGPQLIRPLASTELAAGDVLLLDLFAPAEDIDTLYRRFDLETLPLAGALFRDRTQELGLAEVMVTADSSLVGRSVVAAELRSRTGLTALGLRRGREPYAGAILEQPLRIGDTLLVVGRWSDIERLRVDGGDLIILNLPAERADVPAVVGRAVPALACLAGVVVLMATGVIPNVQAALLGCLLMGALSCIDLDTAYDAIHWKSLVLIVGMMPFSLALQRTGGVDLAAGALAALVAEAGTSVVLGCLFAITAGLGLFISNTATAVLMAPVALALADHLQASPYPFAMIVALAASTAFMTPISSPVNTLVVDPGDYTFGDFVRVGVPFALVVLVVSVLLVPWLLPLRP